MSHACWGVLLGCESFWGACVERSFRMRTLLLLSLTCRAFRDGISVALVVRQAYGGGSDALISKVDARQLFYGLTTYMLRAQPSPVSFLKAFELAWARRGGVLRRIQPRAESVEHKWALVRAQNHARWRSEFEAARRRVLAAEARRTQARRRVEVDALLAAEGAPALEGSRFSRLVWLTHRRLGVPASQAYLGECADGRAEFEWERAASTAQDDERPRFLNLDRMDGLIGCRFPEEREAKLAAHMEQNGCGGGVGGAYFQNCLVGMSPFWMSTMRLHHALQSVPWLAALYQQLKRKNGSGRSARKLIEWRLTTRKLGFESRGQAERTMERLAGMTGLF